MRTLLIITAALNFQAYLRFLYDGSQPVCELSSTGAVTTANTRGGGLLSRHSGTASTFYTFDPSGNVVHRLDNSYLNKQGRFRSARIL